MARKGVKTDEELLVKSVAVRVTAAEHRRLKMLQLQSDCHSIGEVIRRTLIGRQIKLFHRDASLDLIL